MFRQSFLKDSNPVAAAEVIRNLLLQNGLEISQVKPYFELIADCFRKTADEQIKCRLLEEMARLCGSDSFYRLVAGEIFDSIFKEAVNDKNNQIATPAVVGLVRIDQAGAFELLKQKGFTSHPSIKIRSELISIAGQIGTADDLEWLGSILVTAAESDDERRQAADAMMNIFQHCKADVLLAWAQKFAGRQRQKTMSLLLQEQEFCLKQPKKRRKPSRICSFCFLCGTLWRITVPAQRLYGLAAKYYGILLQSSPDPNQTSEITAKLLDVHLRSGQIESVKQIVANFLLSADLLPDAEITKVLDNYFTANQNSEQAGQTFLALASIKISDHNPRPFWSKQLESWKALVKITSNVLAEPNIPAEPNVPAEPNISIL